MAFPALVLLFVFGMGLIGMSEDLFEVSQTWILVSLLIWVVLVAVSWFMIGPRSVTTAREPGAGWPPASASPISAWSSVAADGVPARPLSHSPRWAAATDFGTTMRHASSTSSVISSMSIAASRRTTQW